MLKIDNVHTDDAGRLVVNYIVSHSTPGREGTTVSEPMTLTCANRGSGEWTCSMKIEDATGDTPQAVLLKLQSWLERLSIALKDSEKATVTLPGRF
jgi:hypothetical protein